MDYFARNRASPMGRMDARLKMAVAFCMSVVIVLVDSPVMLGAAASVGVLLFVASMPTLSQVRLVLFSSALLVWGLMFSQALFYGTLPRHALLVIVPPNAVLPEGLKVYAEGVRHGALQSLRLIAIGLTGYAVCFSTEPDEFMKGLRAVRVPFALAFMAVTAVRFIPVVAQEFQTVHAAMRLRGYRRFRGGIRETIRMEVAALRPVLAGTIRRSQEVALSIQTRGFSMLPRERTTFTDRRFGPGEYAVLGLACAVTACIAAAKLLFYLYLNETYYAAELRWLYAFARDWL
jgi:energy-coupling factor transport system permease protein